MKLLLISCLAFLSQSIAAYPTTSCTLQAPRLPVLTPANCVDSAIVQSLVDTLQLFIVSGALQNNLNAPPTAKLPKLPPCSCPVLPTANCKCSNTIQPCLPVCNNCNLLPCNCNPCGCSKPCKCPEVVLPPLVPQLPCGTGYLSAAVPLVTSAYGALETCISPLGSCAEAYVPGSIPVIEPLFPCNCGCGFQPCGATIATPLCRELTNLAQPIIL